jgi:hypothetical protein
MSEPKVLLTGLGIPESPRWHEGRLWFCNWIDRQVVAVGLDGRADVMATRELGGPDRRTLFIMTAEWRKADGLGNLQRRAEGPRTGEILTSRSRCPGPARSALGHGQRTAVDEFAGAVESALQAGIGTPGNRAKMSDSWRIPGL